MSLFAPLALRSVTLRNRIGMSPMCQYSAVDGRVGDWHLVHYGARAVGGVGLVIVEAAGVEARGRISAADVGIWEDGQVEPLARVARLVAENGAVAGHPAGPRRAQGEHPRPLGPGRRAPPARRRRLDPGGAEPPSPSPTATPGPSRSTRRASPASCAPSRTRPRRALDAGFQVVEIHAAHGYLLHEFLSPLSNHRTDRYGGSLENRTRIVREVVEAVRRVWPDRLPLFLRISCTDWTEGGWDLPQTVELARMVRSLGVDVIDCSSGGNVATARIPAGPGYQVPFAEGIRRDAAIATAAVGMITSPAQAETVIRSGQADLVLLARELLRDPQFPLRAARELGVEGPWPRQYLRAK